MFKSSKAPKNYKTMVSLTTLHKEMLDRFLEEGGMTSQSDVIRQALSDFYRKRFPNYVERETTAGMIKKKALEEQAALEALPDRDYIIQNFPDALFTTNAEGIEYVVIHVYGNTSNAFPVAGFKAKAMKDPLLQKYHIDRLRTHPMNDLSGYIISTLNKRYNLNIPPAKELPPRNA